MNHLLKLVIYNLSKEYFLRKYTLPGKHISKYQVTEMISKFIHLTFLAQAALSIASTVKFEISVDQEVVGNLDILLYDETVPKTVANFAALASGSCEFGYENSTFHRIIPGFMIQGGDFTRGDGTGGHSIYNGNGKFPDENFDKKHDKVGILSMANSGPDSNGSQFFITVSPQPHLDGKHVVFGELDPKSFEVLKKIENLGSESGEPTQKVTISKSETSYENVQCDLRF